MTATGRSVGLFKRFKSGDSSPEIAASEPPADDARRQRHSDETASIAADSERSRPS
jgi:hypothetical protein